MEVFDQGNTRYMHQKHRLQANSINVPHASHSQKIKMKILLGPEYVSDEEEADSEEASEGEQEDARDTFVDRTTVRECVAANTSCVCVVLQRVLPKMRPGRSPMLPTLLVAFRENRPQ